MAVSNRKIIEKMMSEIRQAQQNPDNVKTVQTHAAKIKLLCELVLDEEATAIADNEISKEEMKTMLGGGQTNPKQPRLEHDNANGDSIFDF